MKHLEELNDRQREAVLATNGPLLILAGAGAGKTKTLTHRIAHLIKTGVSPENILAVTFTNKAAREMKDRTTFLLNKNKTESSWNSSPFIATFHALGVYLLRRHSDVAKRTKYFSIADREDSLKLVRDAIKASGLDHKQWTPSKLCTLINHQKSEGKSCETLEVEASE